MQQKGNRYKQGIYPIRHPEKYKGDYNKIVYRSSWELRVFKYLDDNPNVIKLWEEHGIPTTKWGTWDGVDRT